MGCVIGVGSILAGFELDMVKTGLIIYAFIAGPIFLASAAERLTEPSDQGTPRATLRMHSGRECVKPDLYSIGRRTYLAALLAMFAAGGAVVLSIRNSVIPGGLIAKWVLVYGAAAVAYFVVVCALKRRYMRLGVSPREKAEFFPTWPRRWPESWLELAHRDEAARDGEKMPAKTPESEMRAR